MDLMRERFDGYCLIALLVFIFMCNFFIWRLCAMGQAKSRVGQNTLRVPDGLPFPSETYAVHMS